MTALGTNLLLVDDDVKLCGLVRQYLEPLGYKVSVAHTGPAGLQMALAGEFDAVILDVMLPQLGGFEVLKQIRAKSIVPVLMLTGLGDEADRIVGLEIGADDYLPKTFSTRELLARLRAVIRRSRLTSMQKKETIEPAIVVGELRMDPETRAAAIGNQPLSLTAVEFDLLFSLAKASAASRPASDCFSKWLSAILKPSTAPSTCTFLPSAASWATIRRRRSSFRPFAALGT